MSKITRVAAQIFGSTASTNQIAKYGSLAASAPVRYDGTTALANVATIQSLSNWLQGWFAGVEGASSPAIEDLNAYCFVIAYQIAYCLQEGVPEWDSSTTYYIGSVANDSYGNLYVSLTDNNLNHALTNTTHWRGSISTSGSSAGATAVGGATAIPVPSNSFNSDIYVQGNGTGWALQTAASAKTWVSVDWSPELSLFAAVALDVSTSNIMTSPDGITWTTRTNPSSQGCYGVAWSPYLELFAATTFVSPNSGFITSPDGITWTNRTTADASNNVYASIIWAQELKLFISLSNKVSTNVIQTSVDGSTWVNQTTPAVVSSSLQSLAWSKELGIVLAIGLTGQILYSKDGVNWKNVASASNAIASQVIWSSALKIFVAVNNSSINYSYDGFVWTNVAIGGSPGLAAISFSEQLGLFVTLGTTTTGYSSPDGINWTAFTIGQTNNWPSITFAPATNKFVAVGETGSSRAMTYLSPAITASPSIQAGTIQGQRITVIGSSDLLPVILNNGSGIALRSYSQTSLKKNNTLKFIWDNAQALWIQG